MRPGFARDRGFTMTEVLVSLTVLLVCIVALVRLYVTAMNAQHFSRRATEAIMLAEDKLESLRLVDATAIVDGVERVSAAGQVFANAEFDGANGYFRRRWRASPDPQGTVHVSVTVSWQQRPGQPRSFTLGTQRP